ncbi:hypothetical protein ACFUTV_26580 [Streptomyces sp. NPDC057298]|uniref:hypothetical protein n=1 Tax=Streptomyces sp. NPDC057298 TaxID=3346091 RepID=UPI00363715CD
MAPLEPEGCKTHQISPVREPNGIAVPNDPARAAAAVTRRVLPRYRAALDAVRHNAFGQPEPPHHKPAPEVAQTLTLVWYPDGVVGEPYDSVPEEARMTLFGCNFQSSPNEFAFVLPPPTAPRSAPCWSSSPPSGSHSRASGSTSAAPLPSRLPLRHQQPRARCCQLPEIHFPPVEPGPRIKELLLSDPDQRMLLHDMADRLNTVADHLPLPDQIHLDPALSEILDDEVRHLARLLGFLAGESAFHHRAAARSPARPTPTVRRTTLALASAAEPTGLASAALSAAVHHLGHLADLPHQAPGPGRARAIATEHQRLVDCLGDSRIYLVRAAKHLRGAADTRIPPAATAVPSTSATTPPSRSR